MTDGAGILIRPRRPGDLTACAESLRRVHRDDAYPVRWPSDPEGWLEPTGLLAAWVAERDGAIAGHAALCSGTGHVDAPYWSSATGLPDRAHGVVSRFWIDPAFRGLGAGRQLLDRTAAEAHLRGLHPVLDVMAHNQGAVALYESLGWRRVGTRDFTFHDGERLPEHIYVSG